MLLKAFAVSLLMALGEVVNGNIRVRLWHKRFGKKRARFYSFLSGTAIIYSICWWTLPWVGPLGYAECLQVGAIWLVVMLLLDIYFGRYVFRFSWRRVLDDFNPMRGNLLSIGMLLLLLSPLVVFRLQQILVRP